MFVDQFVSFRDQSSFGNWTTVQCITSFNVTPSQDDALEYEVNNYVGLLTGANMTSFGFPQDDLSTDPSNEFTMYNKQLVSSRKQKKDNLFFDTLPLELSPLPFTKKSGFDENIKASTKYRVDCNARAPLPKFSTTQDGSDGFVDPSAYMGSLDIIFGAPSWYSNTTVVEAEVKKPEQDASIEE